MSRTLCAAVALLAAASSATAAVSTAEARRLEAVARVIQETRDSIPDNYWTSARCVGVIPDLKKAAFIFGGEYGKGVLSCRAGSEWSAPVFIELAKGSWGFQAGVEQVDLVLLVMNDSGVQKLLGNKVTLGADASVAAGPVGRRGSIGTDVQLNTEILSYSRSQGLFAGINLSGGVLRADTDANVDTYGAGAEPRTVLASRQISAPPEALPFLRALSDAVTAATRETTPPSPQPSTAASTPATSRTTTLATTDDDLRARVVDIQQAIDRILADTTPSPVGTSGAASTTNEQGARGTIAVDRARLLQIRQQLEQLLAALNKR